MISLRTLQGLSFTAQHAYFEKYYDILNFNKSPAVYNESILSRNNKHNKYTIMFYTCEFRWKTLFIRITFNPP